ncbi:MAG TPA: FAD-binding oxidoreductase [Anaerolineales bacterium]|nr:FAD-binding oxidoreductase [Anaerolineales bacterium]
MMKFPIFSCPVYKLGDNQYEYKRYQYATTSQPTASMSPAAIIYPQHPNADPDVERAITYARENNLGIAVRTGGHAYSGTSSTNTNNIQLDLSEAYNDWDYNAETGLLRVGISYSLLEFNTKLKEAGLFMPTGQCYDVHVGGHAQTGGYGQLARAFGLFSDQIVSFEIFLADGTKRVITIDSPEQSDRDLFFAVFGGGPGNYGIVTHITIRPFKDLDHQYARALKMIIPYDPMLDHNVLVQLFDLVQDWKNAPCDYDFCFTVAAGEEDFIANQIGLASKDDFMIKHFGDKNGAAPFNVLLVFFQYSNLDNKPDTYDPTWCNKIEAILATANHGGSWWERFKLWVEQKILNLIVTRDNSKITPISESITRLWTFEGTREFNYPFLKYGQVTDEVASPQWPEWAATQIDQMSGRSKEGLMVFVQCQNFGGQNSAVTRNGRLRQTSYAWRNTTVGYNLDIFYNPAVTGALQHAQDWHNANIAEGVGPNGKFSTTDHRWFWASHDKLDMCEVWPYYYSADDYAKCCKVKAQVDPNGVFTPNTFVVGYMPDSAPKHLVLPVARVNEASIPGQPDEKLDDASFTAGHADRAKRRARAKAINTAKFFR